MSLRYLGQSPASCFLLSLLLLLLLLLFVLADEWLKWTEIVTSYHDVSGLFGSLCSMLIIYRLKEGEGVWRILLRYDKLYYLIPLDGSAKFYIYDSPPVIGSNWHSIFYSSLLTLSRRRQIPPPSCLRKNHVNPLPQDPPPTPPLTKMMNGAW